MAKRSKGNDFRGMNGVQPDDMKMRGAKKGKSTRHRYGKKKR